MTRIIFSLLTAGFYAAECALMTTKLRRRSDRKVDTLKWFYLILPSLALTLLLAGSAEHGTQMILFSNWLDVLSIFPQIVLTRNSHRTGVITLTCLIFWSVFRSISSIMYFTQGIISHSFQNKITLLIIGALYFILYAVFLTVYAKIPRKYTHNNSILPQ